MPLDENVFLREYTDAIREERAALFVGAGVSRGAGYVDWKLLLREIANDLGLDVDRESDLVAVAQYHENDRRGRQQLNQKLIDEFLEDNELTESHRLIATLPLRTVWTTNYDDLIERSFGDEGKRVDVKRRKNDFATSKSRSDVTVYKMHGDRTDPAEAVLTRNDYETFNNKREVFTIALKADLTEKSFLFVGFSFADPNVMYLLSRVRQLLETNSRQHYCFLKSPPAADAYESRRFHHWLEDLRRYHIQPILINDYPDVPRLLKELNRRSHLKDIFISGSAADFAPLGETRFRELCRMLGAELIRKHFNVISGFGVGVGDSVIYGAMQTLKRNDDQRLQLWPFPQELPAGVDRAAFWNEYRTRMISHAGVCLVLAGNKRTDAGIVPADGVRKEIEIARQQGKIVLPIGATGHVARELWEQYRADLRTYFGDIDIAAKMDVIGTEASFDAAIVTAVIEILQLLNR